MINKQRQSKVTGRGLEVNVILYIFKCTANCFPKVAPKCSHSSCVCYTVLGKDVQSPVYLDEVARLAPLSKFPHSP